MPTSASAANLPDRPAKAIALNFDPRYIEFLIEAFLARDLAPIHLDELIAATAHSAQAAFRRLTAMGLHEPEVSDEEIKRVITLFISLGLVKQKKVTPKLPKQSKRSQSTQLESPPTAPAVLAPSYVEVIVTPDGRELMMQPQAPGTLRPGIVRRIIARSPVLTALLVALQGHGPLARPVRSLTPNAPTRGASYTQEVDAGIHAFWVAVNPTQSSVHAALQPSLTKKPTAAKLITLATAEALERHPAGAIKQLDKLVDVASALGVVWCDTSQINDVIAVNWVGSAAHAIDGEFAPNTPTWGVIEPRFVQALLHAHRARADGTGFISVNALRGALGRALALSAPVVDALVCQARADGDQRRSAVTLHFEPNEDVTYAGNRRPLIWYGRAYDQILVSYPPNMELVPAIARRASD